MTVRLGRGEDIYELLKVTSLNGLLGEYSNVVESLETAVNIGFPHGASGADVWIPAILTETGRATSPHGASGADIIIPAFWTERGAAVSPRELSGADVFILSPIATGGALSPHAGSGADVYRSFADMLSITEADGVPLVMDVKRIVFDNGTVTDSGGGIARVTGGSSTPPGYFGDGSDGDVTISADTELLGFKHYNTLTIDAGQALYLDAETSINTVPVIFVKDTLTINGTLRNNGVSAGNSGNNSGATGGTVGSTGSFSGFIFRGATRSGTDGGGGGNAGDVGGHGTAEPGLDFYYKTSAVPVAASGGAGAVGAGGAGGESNDDSPLHLINNIVLATQIVSLGFFTSPPSGIVADLRSGGGGGGGGGVTAGGGGGGNGGGYGGNLLIVARNIVWGVAGAIECKGGNGGNGGNSSGDGGGGGGGAGGNGGIVVLCYETETGSRNVDVSKGTGGTGGTSVSASAGSNGPDGYDGVVIDLGA